MTELATNVLTYGDNLDILRRYLPDGRVDLVDLIDLDPIQLEPRLRPPLPRRVGPPCQ